MYLKQIATILQTAGLGTIGKNIFVHNIPSDLNNCILVRFGPMGTPIDWELPGFYDVTFQVIVRNNDYTNGTTVSNNVVQALTLFQPTVIDDISFKQVYPKSQPYPYRRGDAGDIEFNTMFQAAFVKE